MKVVLCKGQFQGPISGADETLVVYATQLRAAGHSPTVLLMYPHQHGDSYYQRLRRAGVPVVCLAPPTVRASLNAGRRVASNLLRTFPGTSRLVRREAHKISSHVNGRYLRPCQDFLARHEPDLIHVVTPDPSAMTFIRAAHGANIPVLYQELGTPFHPPGFEAHYESFTSVLPLCTEVSTLSPRLAEQCRRLLPQVREISVLPIMTEDARLAPNGNGHRPSHEVTFGFAARVELLKGADVLIEGFALAARRQSPGMRLTIAGAGSQCAHVAARAAALGVGGRCHFAGVYTGTEGKSAFLGGLDVFVLPSLTEGTPNSIVEAMAHGLPVIASAVGGVPDMIAPETGVLVPPGDPAALAEAMRRLASEPGTRRRMGLAARARYKRLFSPAAVLPEVLEAYRRVAMKRPRGAQAAQGREAYPSLVDDGS